MDAAGLLSRYTALLEGAGVECARASDAMLVWIGEGECGPCEGVLLVSDVDTGEAVPAPSEAAVLCELVYVMPCAPVTPLRRHALYELLALLGPEVSLGAFELDAEGRVRHRLTTLVPSSPVSDAYLLAPLYECLDVVDEHAGLFEAVLSADVEPGHVFAEAMLARQDLDPAERDRLQALLDSAAARYRATGRDLHLERVAAVLRPLAT